MQVALILSDICLYDIMLVTLTLSDICLYMTSCKWPWHCQTFVSLWHHASDLDTVRHLSLWHHASNLDTVRHLSLYDIMQVTVTLSDICLSMTSCKWPWHCRTFVSVTSCKWPWHCQTFVSLWHHAIDLDLVRHLSLYDIMQVTLTLSNSCFSLTSW